MFDQNENTDAVQTPNFDPFPEPNTMPSGWDLSALTPDLELAPAAQADHTNETLKP